MRVLAVYRLSGVEKDGTVGRLEFLAHQLSQCVPNFQLLDTLLRIVNQDNSLSTSEPLC